MKKIERIQTPEAIGTEKGKYMWDSSSHHIQNHLITALCFSAFFIISISNGFRLNSPEPSPLAQIGLTFFLTLGIFFLIRAAYDQHHRHIRLIVIVGDKGFGLIKYNEKDDAVLSKLFLTYDKISHIEKRERNDVSEDGIYLQTVCRYTLFAPEKVFSQKVKYNRNDIRLSERDGLPEVKAMFPIEEAYNLSCKEAHITEIHEMEEIIPSHPQPLIRIRKPVMWADAED